MERIRTDIKSGGGKLHPVLNHDLSPTWMPRTVGKGPGGSGNSLPPATNAKWALGEGVTVVRMDRKETNTVHGKGFSLTHTGPGRASRSDKGSATHDSKDYGVGGVSLGTSKGYGVGGI